MPKGRDHFGRPKQWPCRVVARQAQGKVDPAGNVVGFNRSLMVAKYHWSSFEAALYWKSTRKHRGGLTVQGVVASFAHHRYREKGREEDPNKGEMTDTDRQRACGLEHMPPEVLLHITSFIERARDMAAALMASPLLAGRSAVEMAIEYGAVYTGRLLESGAPLNTIKSAVDRRKRPLGRGFIECAVRGGRMDVLRFVCSRVTVRSITPYMCVCVVCVCARVCVCVCVCVCARMPSLSVTTNDKKACPI